MTLTNRDDKYIWHPYTQHYKGNKHIVIDHASGSYLFDQEGKKYIDAISSWWVILHGHSHPYIAEKVIKQLLKLDQVIFAGFTHEPAIELAEKLLNILPPSQQKVFYTDNGSTAIEVALKMCIQFWYNQNQPRSKILAFKNAYHGDTFGAMSVSGRGAWTAPFQNQMFEVIYIDTPDSSNLEDLQNIIETHAADLACFIFEPLVQGSAGMLMHKAEHLDQLMAICRRNGILMIQDEVFTGFGRTGRNFAADHLQQQADILCFSKGLTGGTMPLGITTCSSEIYAAFLAEDNLKTLFHGHSFTANPLACAAASASLDLLAEPDCQAAIQRIATLHSAFATSIELHPLVRSIRQTGTILAVEWETGEGTSYFHGLRDWLYNFFLDKGIILRPLGNIIYILPPYCITNTDLGEIYAAIREALDLKLK